MKLLSVSLVLVLAMFAGSGCVLHTTGETEVGVRTRKIGLFGPKGVEERIYPPGATYFFLPYINDWHVFDTKLQNLEMTFSQIRGDRRTRDDLVFKTIDGNDISLDVIIAYRIDADKATHILQYVARDDKTLRDTVYGPWPAANPGTFLASSRRRLFTWPSPGKARPKKPRMPFKQSWAPWV